MSSSKEKVMRSLYLEDRRKEGTSMTRHMGGEPSCTGPRKSRVEEFSKTNDDWNQML